jgi:hypothetical protein
MCSALKLTFPVQLFTLYSFLFITRWWLPGDACVINYPNPLSHRQHTSTNLYIYIYIYKDYTTAIIWFPQQCVSSKFLDAFILAIRRLFHYCNSCCRSRSYFTTDQSVSKYVLVSITLVGLATRYYFLLECYCQKFAVLYLWGALSDERMSPIYSVITQWSESRRTGNHTLLSRLRLPQPGGPGSRIYIPRNRVAQLCPLALGSLYVASCDSQGYGGGILTLPLPGGTGSCIYSLQEQEA